MKKLVEDLQKIITNQTDLYRKLFSVLCRENEIIQSSSVDDLNRNNKKKDVIILQIKLLDNSCEKLLEKIYKHLSRQPAPLSIHKLIEIIREPYITPLKSVYLKLVSVAQTVKEQNTENERLIKGSLRAIKSSISFLLACASFSSPVYESSGQLKTENIAMTVLKEEA